MKILTHLITFQILTAGTLLGAQKSDAELERINMMLEGAVKLVVAVIFFAWLLSKFRKKDKKVDTEEITKAPPTPKPSMDEMLQRLKDEHEKLNKSE